MKDQNKTTIDLDNIQIAFERKTDKELREAIRLFKMMNKKFLVNIGSSLTLFALKIRLPIKGIIKRTIFKQFCGGTDLEECQNNIAQLASYGVGSVMDYGAEAKSTDEDFDKTVTESLRAIRFASQNGSMPVISCKVTGLTPFNILEKITAKKALSSSEQEAYDRALKRLDDICREAQMHKIGLFIDAEESWIQDAIDQMTDEMMERYNKDHITVYNTFQMYRHDRLAFLKTSYQRAEEKGYILGAKLVRGAYMEKERERAEEMGYPSPIQPDKASSDRDYDEGVKFCIENHEKIASCVASHNKQSTLYQIELMEEKGISKDHPHLSFCQLYGMSDNMTFNLAKAGYQVWKYVPYGPVKDVIPYLIRRARENSAASGEVSRELGMLQKELKRRKKAK